MDCVTINMREQELRIGNWIIDCFDKRNGEEIQVDLDFLQAINNFYRSNSPYPMKPIPLTEEWLLKFGFKEDNRFSGLRVLSLELEEAYVKIVYFNNRYITIEIDGNRALTEIKYVHQLQNLVFSIDGKELVITS